MAINSVTSGSAPQTVQQTQQSADSRQVEAQRAAETESPRVLRRLLILREWSHEQIKQIFP